jgi:hypothetical protein
MLIKLQVLNEASMEVLSEMMFSACIGCSFVYGARGPRDTKGTLLGFEFTPSFIKDKEEQGDAGIAVTHRRPTTRRPDGALCS